MRFLQQVNSEPSRFSCDRHSFSKPTLMLSMQFDSGNSLIVIIANSIRPELANALPPLALGTLVVGCWLMR
jgi:hypothetical protein